METGAYFTAAGALRNTKLTKVGLEIDCDSIDLALLGQAFSSNVRYAREEISEEEHTLESALVPYTSYRFRGDLRVFCSPERITMTMPFQEGASEADDLLSSIAATCLAVIPRPQRSSVSIITVGMSSGISSPLRKFLAELLDEQLRTTQSAPDRRAKFFPHFLTSEAQQPEAMLGELLEGLVPTPTEQVRKDSHIVVKYQHRTIARPEPFETIRNWMRLDINDYWAGLSAVADQLTSEKHQASAARNIEQLRELSMGSFADIDNMAVEYGIEAPSKTTRDVAEKLLLKLFELHPSDYMVLPFEDGGISIHASNDSRHSLEVDVNSDGRIICHLLRDGEHSDFEYLISDAFPSKYYESALRSQGIDVPSG